MVEAVCDGLKSDSVVLEFAGAPAYQPGLSPQVEDRPYVRYTKAERQLQVYGKDSPTFATSFAVNHSSGLAADDNEQTYWQPSDDDEAPAWTLDVERTLLLKEIHAKFLQSVNAIIEISTDQETWTEVGTVSQEQVDVLLDSTPRARFIRFRFGAGTHPQLVDATVKGYVP